VPPILFVCRKIWQIHDSSLFLLPGYNPLVYKTRRNNVQGGGVGIYVKHDLKFTHLPQISTFVDRILESILIELTLPNNTKSIIGSVYRPGTKHPLYTINDQFTQFCELFSQLCNELTASDSTNFIAGDFNLDVLQYGKNTYVTEYIDSLFSFGLLQIITKPTRIVNRSATVIDHIITNSLHSNHNSVILTSRISDHFPIINFPDL
jgi:hypothetical protein